MNLVNKIIISISVLVSIIVFSFIKGKQLQENRNQMKEQLEQIQIQNEIIHDNQIVRKRQNRNSTTDINPALEWLRLQFCENCKGR